MNSIKLLHLEQNSLLLCSFFFQKGNKNSRSYLMINIAYLQALIAHYVFLSSDHSQIRETVVEMCCLWRYFEHSRLASRSFWTWIYIEYQSTKWKERGSCKTMIITLHYVRVLQSTFLGNRTGFQRLWGISLVDVNCHGSIEASGVMTVYTNWGYKPSSWQIGEWTFSGTDSLS